MMVVIVVVTIHSFGWKISTPMGIAWFILYFVFLAEVRRRLVARSGACWLLAGLGTWLLSARLCWHAPQAITLELKCPDWGCEDWI